MKKYLDYAVTSLIDRRGMDLIEKDIDHARAKTLTIMQDSDLLVMIKFTPVTRILGYVGFNRRTDMYFWISDTRVCRRFNPKTGRLGAIMPIPKGTMRVINAFEKEAEKKRYYDSNRTGKRRN